MHHMGVVLDSKLLCNLNGSDFRDAADIIATQIEQHQMLRAFLRIGEKVLGQSLVFCSILAPRPSAGDRPNRDCVVAEPDQDFWT